MAQIFKVHLSLAAVWLNLLLSFDNFNHRISNVNIYPKAGVEAAVLFNFNTTSNKYLAQKSSWLLKAIRNSKMQQPHNKRAFGYRQASDFSARKSTAKPCYLQVCFHWNQWHTCYGCWQCMVSWVLDLLCKPTDLFLFLETRKLQAEVTITGAKYE